MKKNLFKLLKPLIPKYLLGITIGLTLNILIILSTYIYKLLLDTILPSKNISFLLHFIIGYIIFYILKNIIYFFKEYTFSKYSYYILYELRNKIFSSIIKKFNFICFSSQKQGYIITLFRDWINSISWFLSNILLNTITELILLILGIILLIVTNVKMFYITILILPLYGTLYIIFNSKIRNTRMEMMNKDVDVTQNLKESLDSIKEIRIFNTENICIKKYNSIQNKFTNLGIKYTIITTIYDSLSNIISTLGQIIIIYYGALEVFNNKMSVGTLLALTSLISLLYSPIEKIINFNRLMQVFKAEFTKLNTFMEENTTTINPKLESTYSPSLNYNENIFLKLDKVSFNYTNLDILNNINIIFKKGLTYALVGENGCGKSTLINLILGLLIPSKGNIYANTINIHENLSEFRHNIGYVPQDTFLSNDSVINNITLGRHDIAKSNFDKLLEICDINNILKESLIDLDTNIGEKGNKLSGGQKQKIALCRALYNTPTFLIIDEGTCNIDSECENKIIKNIKLYFPEISILIVSHRLSTIKLADEIIILKNGSNLETIKVNDIKHNSYFNKIFANHI